MKPRIRVILAAVTLSLGAAVPGVAAAAPVAHAVPAAAHTITEQQDPGGYYPNFWNGGKALSAYNAPADNNWVQIQSIPPLGYFQLLDRVHGGCIGDNGNLQGAHRAGGGLACNSTSTGTGGGWGTRFQIVSDALCGSVYHKYWNVHWVGYLGWSDSNGAAVFLNTTGNCIRQISAVIGGGG